ncbi:MAG TPA: translation initiation factor IF-2 [Candidatus Nanoarchaeia archaeon]
MAKNRNSTIKQRPTPTLARGTTRPPVVAILGHVDHGKTTLLDYIRKSHVAEREFGAITQHIGAYQIEHNGRKITFIDTPGHEAFSAMRARGGQVSDLAVLVIAVDDGVMPQTKESIAHIKAANIPFIVAANKIDIPGTNIEKVKKQLSENDVLVEDYGGDVVVVPVSAKTGEGTVDLLEMTLLLADMQELKANQDKPFSGVVIEAKLDKFKGPLATILVKEGILHVGDALYTDSAIGKVKILTDADGKGLKEAYPSTPVEVLGFTSVPKIGELTKITSESKIRTVEKAEKVAFEQKIGITDEGEIRLIIKTDVVGSLEAITNSLESLKAEDKKVKIYHSSTGDISESDVLLAAATRSLIIGFNVLISKSVERLAAEEKVLIRVYNLIYELLDELREGLTALEQKKEEVVYGEAVVVKTFQIRDGKAAGCKIEAGKVNKEDTIIIKRNEKEIGRSKITSMKHRESDINEATEGEEFGVVLEKNVSFTKGDIMVAIGRSVTK